MIFNRFGMVTFALVLGVTGMGMGWLMLLPAGTAHRVMARIAAAGTRHRRSCRIYSGKVFVTGLLARRRTLTITAGGIRTIAMSTAIRRLPRDQREAYRDGFRRGYQRGQAHLTGQDQQQPMRGPDRGGPGYDRGGPGMGPGAGYGAGVGQGPGNDIRIRGFQDGMDGALKDLDNHRRPDPNNRDEFRRPNNVPYQMQDVYRDGFRRGYQRGIAVLTGGPGSDRRYQGPGMEIRTRGFQDGAEGAIRDFDNNRRPDPNNRDEYRHPNNVPYPMMDAYRDGFARGYNVVARELMGYSGRHY